MDIRKLETFELRKLIENPDMPEPLVMEALDELHFREQNRIPEEEIIDIKNP